VTAARLAETADFVTQIWRRPDASIWELSDHRDYTQGKLAAWLALERAVRRAETGHVPATNARRWRAEAERIRRHIDGACWSDERQAFVREAGSAELDAGVLLAARAGVAYLERGDPRIACTVAALRDELGRGPLLYRYSGMEDEEGAFLACSFWLAEALAQAGELDEAAAMMDELVGLGNDVGLYSEEMDPDSGDMLGNFPQALTHLSLVNAACVIDDLRGD
jgi:GH15 family glucan-1,4-alpha-glucosidase